MNLDGGVASEERRAGRPRKWTSDAERARAYRARKAIELGGAEAIRNELRGARAQVRRLTAELEREVTRRQRAEGRIDSLSSQLDASAQAVAREAAGRQRAQQRAMELFDQLERTVEEAERLRRDVRAATAATSAGSGVSRPMDGGSSAKT